MVDAGIYLHSGGAGAVPVMNFEEHFDFERKV